jgi:hypothetical protein
MTPRSEFEDHVIADLAVLKAQMAELLGIGQPGRLRELEARVKAHERLVQRFAGVGAFVGALLTLFHTALDYLKLR